MHKSDCYFTRAFIFTFKTESIIVFRHIIHFMVLDTDRESNNNV